MNDTKIENGSETISGSTPSAKKYAIKYKFSNEMKEGGYSKEEILADGEDSAGGCDAHIFVSILRDGKAHTTALDHAMMSVDGHNNGEPIPNTELFSHFNFVAYHLKDCQDIPEWQRMIANHSWEVSRYMVTKGKHGKQGDPLIAEANHSGFEFALAMVETVLAEVSDEIPECKQVIDAIRDGIEANIEELSFDNG